MNWIVDQDNGAWPEVRAAAIRAALIKGQDYAAALGGAVISVEHVADAGLLGGENGGSGRRVSALAMSGAVGDMGVSFDPAPQELTATIDARFVATIAALPGA